MLSWSEDLFDRQFGIPMEETFKLCERSKAVILEYTLLVFNILLLHNSKDFDPILRMLRGACELDMIWYGVQIQTVSLILRFLDRRRGTGPGPAGSSSRRRAAPSTG